jgi:hypothetical protein
VNEARVRDRADVLRGDAHYEIIEPVVVEAAAEERGAEAIACFGVVGDSERRL